MDAGMTAAIIKFDDVDGVDGTTCNRNATGGVLDGARAAMTIGARDAHLDR
jgi:hypothetical protein